ncbi:MAG: alkaline phosphatase family protein [Anaerolineae bacterium]|nr:alkaline phosphatase family protein [Anaerolineae bacterium]
MNREDDLLSVIHAHRVAGLELGGQVVFPDYNGYSVLNLPASICRWLGKPPLREQPALASPYLEALQGAYEHVFLVVVDGLGYDLLQRFRQARAWGLIGAAEKERMFSRALIFPLTSIVPSTTANALTTLWTGASPAEHGIIGYELWLKEYGIVTNMINFSPASFSTYDGGLQRGGFSADTFLSVPTLGAYLCKQDIQVNAFQHISIAYSTLSKMCMPNVNMTAYRTLGDLWAILNQWMLVSKNSPTYNYVYWGELDTLIHLYGPDDERILVELSNFFAYLSHLIGKLEENSFGRTLLLLTADHGAVETLPNPQFDLKNYPLLSSCLTILPTGESRLPFLYVKPGCEDRLISYVQETWGKQFDFVRAEQVVASGLLGEGITHPNLLDRLGDWLLFPRENAYWWWWPHKENKLRGRHGGLHPSEMVVPLVAWSF